MLTQERLRELLEYEPGSGVFTWKDSREVAGTVDSYGYIQIQIDRRCYKAHRLAFLYMTGENPISKVDHRNGFRADNKWGNVRHATHKQNLENVKLNTRNTSGFRGVTWVERLGKWRAQVTHFGKCYHIGVFDSPAQAAVAAKTKRDELFTHHHTSHSA